MTFGGRLRDAREKARVSQSDLTRISGVPKTMLSRYENDHILPSIATLRKLAKALGLSVSGLLGDGQTAAHAFVATLTERGVVFESEADAQRLGNVIADMVDDSDARVRFLREVQTRLG